MNTVASLPAKWRKDAERFGGDRGLVFDLCAMELKAALATPAVEGGLPEDLADRLAGYSAQWDAGTQWSGDSMAALLRDADDAANLIRRLATPEQPNEIVRLRALAAMCLADCTLPSEAWVDVFRAASEGQPFTTEWLMPFAATIIKQPEQPEQPSSAVQGEEAAALLRMFRALVDAGGPTTIARHGVERGSKAWVDDVRAGMLVIERRFHPERFNDYIPPPAPAADPFPQLRELVAEWEQSGGDILPSKHFANELQGRLDAITGDDLRAMVRARQQDNLRISREDEAQPEARGVEEIAKALWHRFGDDSRMEWEDEPEKAIYRDAAAQVIALATPEQPEARGVEGMVHWPKWLHDRCLEALEKVEIQFASAGTCSAAVSETLMAARGLRVATPNPVRAEQQECGAIGSQGCTYRPEGPRGEMQCTYCGAEPPEVQGANWLAERIAKWQETYPDSESSWVDKSDAAVEILEEYGDLICRLAAAPAAPVGVETIKALATGSNSIEVYGPGNHGGRADWLVVVRNNDTDSADEYEGETLEAALSAAAAPTQEKARE